MTRLSLRRLGALALSLAVLAITAIVAVLSAAAPHSPGGGGI